VRAAMGFESLIIKGRSVKTVASSALTCSTAKTTTVCASWSLRGLAHEDVQGAMLYHGSMAKGTRCTNYMYHADIEPAERNEHLTDAQWTQAVDTLERIWALKGSRASSSSMKKEGRVHRHVIWSRIDADTMTALPDSLTYPKHELAAREIERDFGLKPRAFRAGERAAGASARTAGQGILKASGPWQTGLTPDQVKAEVTALWHGCDSGAAFRAALEANGYILCAATGVITASSTRPG